MFERLIESILWNSRLIVLVPVLASLLLSMGAFVVTTVDAVVLLWHMISYLDPALNDTARDAMRLLLTSDIVNVVNGYLLAAVLFIFALGLYELFINRISGAEGSEFASRLLLIRNLDDFKDRIANVILLVLVLKFFQHILNLRYSSVMDLLYLALAIILIAGSLYLTKNGRFLKPPDKV